MTHALFLRHAQWLSRPCWQIAHSTSMMQNVSLQPWHVAIAASPPTNLEPGTPLFWRLDFRISAWTRINWKKKLLNWGGRHWKWQRLWMKYCLVATLLCCLTARLPTRRLFYCLQGSSNIQWPKHFLSFSNVWCSNIFVFTEGFIFTSIKRREIWGIYWRLRRNKWWSCGWDWKGSSWQSRCPRR